ncbi:MAG: glutamine-hydrolyzing carbamoyl-phosphate synthase small subunit [Candidatus Diapherotrites archaeon]|nr:glutamine-hydrolyzing carbamoyl-phosphate synthase small subunit [Candidatus Diapherotrites archaeon]
MTDSKQVPAKLILEDGSVFEGTSFGFEASSSGEVVFNTGMVGYCESLTDPSYAGQILACTYPLIGNYGVPKEKKTDLNSFFESHKIHVQGLVVSDYSYNFNHFEAQKSLSEWLVEEKIPAVTGIDTRQLTKRLREKGAMLGKLIVNNEDTGPFDPNSHNIVKKVSTKKEIIYGHKNTGPKIMLMDCGVKNNIIRSLVNRNCVVTRVPFDQDFFAKGHGFDGVVVSNGPGDPKQCTDTISVMKKILQKEIPLFGICLGNQLLALAIGADTFKLKYGHRGQNQPCKIAGTQKCFVTSQNHGFAVNVDSLPKGEWKEWFYNLNDGTNEGIIHASKPFMSVQFHPEACPGPTDTGFLFDEFLSKINGGGK